MRCLGQSAYGTWSLIVGLFFYYLLLEFGVYNTIAKKSAEAKVHGDQAEIDALYTTGIVLGFGNFCIILAVGLGMAVFAGEFFGESDYLLTTRYSIMIFSCMAGLQVLSRPAFGILAGAMRWNLLAVFAMARTILSSIGAFVFLTPNLPVADNLLRMACVNSLFFGLEAFALFISVRLGGHARLRFQGVTLGRVKLLWRFGAPLFVSQIGGILRNRTQIYILALMVGTAPLTFYSLARQFVVYMQDIISNVFGIMNPYFSRLQAMGDADGYRRSLLEALRLSYTTSCLIGLGLILYGDVFIVRWLGTEFLDVYTVLLPLALSGIMEHGEIPAQGFLVGLDKHRVLAVVSLGLGVLITVFSFPAAWLWGLRGVAWGVCVLTLASSLGLMPVLVSRAAEMPVWRYYHTILISLGPQVVVQLAYYYCIRDFLYPEYGCIFLYATGQALVCSIVFLVSVLPLLRKAR